MINATAEGLQAYSGLITQPTALNVVDIYRTVCTGLDRQVIVCLFLILTFYTMTKVVMPLSEEGLGVYSLIFKDIYAWTEEILDGLCLLAISYVIVLLWLADRLTGGFKIWFIVLISFVILAVVPKFIAWWRGGRKSSTLRMVKDGIEKISEEKV
jgi:hypothetical protein